MRKRAGFTLIEILMVVVIMGIASAIIIPQIGTRDDLKVGAAARIMMADLIYAQNRAINTQTTHYVQFDSGFTGYKLLTALPAVVDGDYVTNPTTLNRYAVTFGTGGTHGMEDVKLVSSNFDGKIILAFDSLGTPMACGATANTAAPMASGRIVLSNRSGSYSVTISIEPYTGEISVQ